MTSLKDTLEQLIPNDWGSNIEYADVKYVVYSRMQPHCDQATKYRDVSGKLVYTCTHKRKEE